jgi:filamentous hemagglutinin family protein
VKKIRDISIINFVLLFYLSCVNQLYASNIQLDGTLGSAGNIELQGPEYKIKAEFGEQKGSNLFHSFHSFNLQSKETAIFQGPSDISNIFSRVTGEASYINGTITSDIQGANLYFINPSGMMFGPDASIDITGSFHATTAHYISFSDNQPFFSSPLQKSVLSSSPPSAFGFLNNTIAPITIEGYGEITDASIYSHSTGLAVNDGQTLSLIGGDIEISKGSFFNTIETIYDYSGQAIDINVSRKSGSLTAINGQINLISIASKGEVYIHNDSLDTSSIQSFAEIKLIDKSLLDVTGDSPQGIFIRGGNFVVSDSDITANATGSGDSGVIDIQADNILFTRGSQIFINNYGSGNSTDIKLIASEEIIFSGENNMIESSGIESLSTITDDNGGDSGSIFMQAENIMFSDGATIVGNTYGGGKGSDVTLIANNRIVFQGSNSNGDVSKISLETHGTNEKAGNGGQIHIESADILFKDGALINCLVFGHGSAGNIYMNGTREIHFSGNNNDPYQTFMISNLFEKTLPKNPGGVIAFVTPFSNGGNGAEITIEGGDLSLMDSCLLLSCTFGEGDSGNISIRSNGTIRMDDALAPGAWWNACITTGTIPYGPIVSGDGGDIDITSKNLLMSGGAAIDCGVVAYYGEKSGSSGNITIDVSNTIRLSGVNPHGLDANDLNDDSNTRIFAKTVGFNNTGAAGNISIKAGSLYIDNGAMISASTNTNTPGGKIDIQVLHDINISGDASNERYIKGEGVRIIQNSGIFSRSYDKGIDSGASGKITLSADKLFINDHAAISTSSQGSGNSGNITLSLSSLELNNEASVSSASKHTIHGGDAGTIVVNAGDDILLRNNSQLTTEAIHSGATHDDFLSGKIRLTSNNICLLNSRISSSVNGGNGQGGDIHIHNVNIMTLNKGHIIANAYEGIGGNILIDSKHIVQSSDSLISASSELGIDGNIHIDSSIIDFSNSLATLTTHFLDASRWIQTPCALRTGKQISKFYLSGRDGLPPSPNDWLASIYPLSVIQGSHPDALMLEFDNFIQKGDYLAALNVLEKRKPDADTKMNLTDVHIKKSDIYKKLGHYQKALSQLNLALSNKINNTPIQNAIIYDKIVDCSLLTGHTETINNDLKLFQNEVRKSENAYLNAAYLNTTGIVNAINAHYINAISNFEACLHLINHSDRCHTDFQSLKSKVMINKLRVYDMVHEKELTFQAFNDAFEFVSNRPNSFDAVCDMISLGILAISLKNKYIAEKIDINKNAFDLLNKALKLAPQFSCQRMMSFAAGYLGMIYLNNNQLSEAVLLTQKAIFHADQIDSTECLFLWQWQMGKIYRQYQNIDKAIRYYQKSISTMNTFQPQKILGYRDHSDVFVLRIKPIYLEFTAILLEKAEQSDNSDIYQQRLVDCIQHIDIMKSAQMHNYFKDECLYTTEENDEFQLNIRSKEVVLYPVLLKNHLELLLIYNDQLKRVKVDVDRELVSKTILDLRRHIENWEETYINEAKKLYQWIIRPIENDLTKNGVHTLIISPDGPLCLIPFSVLYDENQYLIEKFAIATIPSISLMDFQNKTINDNQILLSGLSESRHGDDPLPGVKRELTEIHKIIGGELLIDQSFTKANLTELFYSNSYSVIHFATHGYFGHSSKDTFLTTYDGQLTMNDLETLVGRIMYRGDTVDLMTLSACQTALGDAQAAFGIAGITLKAGVKSTVASLWSVDDKAACYVFTEFYRLIKQTKHTKAIIMQNICKTMIENNKFDHPVFWAPFLMIGDWR